MTDKNKKFTLRFTLATIVTLLILSVSSLTLAITYFGGVDSIHSLSRVFTSQVAKGIVGKIDQLFNSAEESGNIASFAIGTGIVDPLDEAKSLQLATFVLSQNPDISSVDIATPDGSKYKASRELNGAILKRSDVRTSKNVVRKYYSDDLELLKVNPNTTNPLDKGYDARTRPWFQKAVSSGTGLWTDIYVSSSDKQFVYSFTKPVYDPKKNLLAVVAIDLQVTALSHFLAELKLFERGKSFIVNDQRQIIAYPSQSNLGSQQVDQLVSEGKDKSYKLYTSTNFPDQNLRIAISSYADSKSSFFEFRGDDDSPWLGIIENYPYRGGMNFLVGIYFPESSIMAGVYTNAVYILTASVLLLLISVFAGNYFARRISSELSILSKDVDRAGRLDIDEKHPTNSRIIEIDSMDNSIARMKVSLKSFKKYVPLELVRQLNSLGQEAFIGGEKQFLTVFFSDIANFTDISESLPPERLLDQLSDYFDGMSHEILSNQGTLDKYIGDSVMAFWGAPIPQNNHAYLACNAALNCKIFTDDFCAKSLSAGKPIFSTRIGLHTGDVVVGNIGNHERMNYTIIGDTVNLASRLEALNKYYGTSILISDATYQLVADAFIARKLDLVAVKGRAEGLLIYELISSRSEANRDLEQFVTQFNIGVQYYLKKSWHEALEAFNIALSMSPRNEDLPSTIMMDRCRHYLRSPPPQAWNGVYKYGEK